jgi:hypothetical protein
MAAIKKNSEIDWKWVIPTALGAVIVVGGFLWAAHSEISRIDDRLVALDKHISRVETAVRIIGAKQGGDTKTLTDEALTVAANASHAGRIENAKVSLDVANRLLEQQKNARINAPQQFFDDALNNYQSLKTSPALKESVHDGLLKLAEYRTEIAEVPPDVQQAHIGKIWSDGHFRHLEDSFLSGEGSVANSPEGFDIDGFILRNVTFDNVTIVYRGGPLSLHNVRFVNCRFKVPDSPQADRLLVVAVKQQTDANIS